MANTPKTIPFGKWHPDKADRANPATEAKGVFAYAGNYAPFPDLQNYGADSGVDANTIVLLHFDGADASTAAPDDGPVPKPFTAAGNAQIDTAQSVFGGASALFDGTGDWFSTPDHAAFTFGSGPLTIDARIRPAVDGSALRLAGQGPVGLAAASTPWFIERLATNKLRASVSNGSAFTTVDSTTNIVTGAFYLVALVIDRAANLIRLFINGTQEASAAFSGTLPDSSSNLRVGAAGEDTTTPWNGWIDEFRISNVARWTAAFTVPTLPYNFGAGAEDV